MPSHGRNNAYKYKTQMQLSENAIGNLLQTGKNLQRSHKPTNEHMEIANMEKSMKREGLEKMGTEFSQETQLKESKLK
jgi:hypothetical protein